MLRAGVELLSTWLAPSSDQSSPGVLVELGGVLIAADGKPKAQGSQVSHPMTQLGGPVAASGL